MRSMKISTARLLLAAVAVAAVAMTTNAYAQQSEDAAAPAPPSPFAPGQSIYFSDPMINGITSQLPLPPFDMENDNAIFKLIIPNLGTWIHQEVSPHFSDPSLSFRYVTLILNAGYDATAPYHETAVGVYSRIDNRPASEYADSYNINVASICAIYQLVMAFDPEREMQ